MTSPIALKRIHHVAYRCRDAAQTVEWYERVLGMRYTTAFSEDHVPSTGEYDPYMHVFLDCGGGNVLAFFELPNQPDMDRDPNTPAWVHRLELACNIGTAEQYAELKSLAPIMLEDWRQTKTAPRHADWLHKDPDAKPQA